ncbi:hypothetical protein PHYBLDRAFT_166521 [Phycomyces blakesleeanus NRRL 1555(-)]|uniref:Homeodomain-like DNA binding domain-containing transcription factor n=1 Tax=Phycomyces blakesleeanus (strain ATCC 8743b / DSM 1359 / FGSC 10004 / NBRC 33097 / NRRL 1555) TaxID=763407 RepID=A0A162UCN8_PHYB8|nr:hypothetical protein PHYBLDRAFT_166521 [Phycomyces blakesleeanus NRRL 1555(-)]OAD75262.1 hypothetical protein PHYBLDRAFT_166521 [Phycomyces blakesleeanus NRRL 1555(-)]|eukprot:XP_018293302.1 hypothetical protein PHYBLDRAFT_166521 [Phycomyces blakesleeanus NRRL 1555(-)]
MWHNLLIKLAQSSFNINITILLFFTYNIPLQFFHEDGQGNAMNEDGREPVLSEVDLEALPLDTITNFDIHSDLKPPEKDVKQKAPDVVDKRGSAGKTERRIIRKHGDDIRALSFFHVYEKGLSISKAAKTVGIPPKTADNWYKADQAEIEKRFKTDQDNPNYKSNEAIEDKEAKPGRKKKDLRIRS